MLLQDNSPSGRPPVPTSRRLEHVSVGFWDLCLGAKGVSDGRGAGWDKNRRTVRQTVCPLRDYRSVLFLFFVKRHRSRPIYQAH